MREELCHNQLPECFLNTHFSRKEKLPPGLKTAQGKI